MTYYRDSWRFVHLATCQDGDIAELGVFNGGTFQHLYREARALECGVWAFDTFTGLPEPGPRDFADVHYEGKFAYSQEAFRRRFPDATVVCGRVEETLPWICKRGVRFRFAYLDIDQYATTLRVLPTLWQMMHPGGVMLCDDVVEGRTEAASGAVHEWAASQDLAVVPPQPGRTQAIFYKP